MENNNNKSPGMSPCPWHWRQEAETVSEIALSVWRAQQGGAALGGVELGRVSVWDCQSPGCPDWCLRIPVEWGFWVGVDTTNTEITVIGSSGWTCKYSQFAQNQQTVHCGASHHGHSCCWGAVAAPKRHLRWFYVLAVTHIFTLS